MSLFRGKRRTISPIRSLERTAERAAAEMLEPEKGDSIADIILPEGCRGNATTIIEGAEASIHTRIAKVLFACPGINMGAVHVIYESPEVYEGSITSEYRQELVRAAEIHAAGVCATCCFNPNNQAPIDLSELDEPPR